MLDTGVNISESLDTLHVQQALLIRGKRQVQMFPTGTPELPLPKGMQRHVNARGVFHYNPAWIGKQAINTLSSEGRENVFLMLGPFSKPEIVLRLMRGEFLQYITEYTPDGVEVRSAVGTNKTVDIQKQYFDATKEPENTIVVGEPPLRVRQLLRK